MKNRTLFFIVLFASIVNISLGLYTQEVINGINAQRELVDSLHTIELNSEYIRGAIDHDEGKIYVDSLNNVLSCWQASTNVCE